jgi:hypothetical protein
MSNRGNAWIAFFIYMLSAEIVVTAATMSMPWQLWLLLQPIVVVLGLFLIGLTFGGKDK